MTSLEYNQGDIEKLKKDMEQREDLDTPITNIELQLDDIIKNLDYIDNQSRRNNLRFEEVNTTRNNTWDKGASVIR